MKTKILFFTVFLFFSQCICLRATTVVEKEVKCGSCGTLQKITVLNSTSSFGPMQLDTRPAPPASHNHNYTLQICRNCGVCSMDLSKPVTEKKALAFLKKNEKKKENLKDLAFAYHTAAKIELLQNGNYLQAALLELRAAWVCDDAGRIAQSVYCRKKAIQYLQAHMEKGKFPADHWLLLADMQRRCGLFADAERSLKNLRAGKNVSGYLLILADKESLFLAQKITNTSCIAHLPVAAPGKEHKK